MSRIIIDARMIGESGIGRYIKNLLKNLQLIDKKNEYFVLHLIKDLHNIEYQDNFHKVRADFRWYGVKEQIELPKVLAGLSPDLVHFPHFNVPILYKGRFVVTIHDLIHQHFSMQRVTTHGLLMYKLKQLGYKKVFNNALNKSQKILVPSKFVREQLSNDWKISTNKITVTHEAVDDSLLIIEKRLMQKETDKILNKFNINLPFLFYVGNAHPHKNVEGLIKVFKQLKERYPKLLLVLSGNDHYFWQRIRGEFEDKNIIYTGLITDEQLVAFYNNALCFLMPSFEEGFGIPILEAMACSCPVVSSNAGSLPEVGADACLYFDPNNLKDMYEKIEMIVKSDKLRKDLIDRGAKRVKDFSWKKLAEQTLEVYKECV